MLHFLFEFPKYVLELVFASQCFLWSMERKKNFRRRNLIFLGSLALVSVILAFAAARSGMGDYGLMPAVCYTVLSLGSITFVFLLYEDTFWNRMACCICGLFLQIGCQKLLELVICLWELGGLDPALLSKDSLLRYGVYYAIFMGACAVCTPVFGKTFRKSGGISVNGKIVTVFLLVLSRNLISNNIDPILRPVDLEAYGWHVFSEAAYYVLILCMFAFLFQAAKSESDSRVTRELWRQDKRQYEKVRESIEIVNIKCHDLRHQIRAMEQSGRADEGFLRELEQSITIYDSSVKSGNDTLDVILMDKRLHCEASSIQLTCITDGALLSFMERSDVISLFSNLLENAMEYEVTVPDAEKRFISLTVRAVNHFLNIHVENYFDGELQLRDGLPMTGKSDKGSHGYGLKSVRYIAEQYGGSMDVRAEDRMFQVNILIPLTDP